MRTNGGVVDHRRNPRANLLPELVALDDYRLAHDWSWEKLGDVMERPVSRCRPARCITSVGGRMQTRRSATGPS